jgi:superfamily II DNA or RNA helicase
MQRSRSRRKSSNKSSKSARKSRKQKSRQKSKRATCIKRSMLKVNSHQREAINIINKQRSLLVVHGTGSGKTLTAVTASQCFLDAHPRGRAVFVGPTALQENFKKEMGRYGVENDNKYEIYSYSKFLYRAKAGNNVVCSNTILIIDEAHNLRNPVGQIYHAVLHCAHKASKVLLLTATPFINNMMDFISLINLLHNKTIIGTRKEYKNGEVSAYISPKVTDLNIDLLREYLKDKVHYIERPTDKSKYPTRIDHNLDIRMRKPYYDKYMKMMNKMQIDGDIFNNPKKFYNGYRRAVNKIGGYLSSKLLGCIPYIKGKTVIYSNWLEYGIEPLAKLLKKYKFSYLIFSGATSAKERKQIIKEFNEGDTDVLVITRAGGEGLDLKGVQSIFVLDPPWNDSALQQIIGRAIRYESHIHLPKYKRKVNVYMARLVSPKGNDITMSGDTILYGFIDTKREIGVLITQLLKDISV